ncbi:hypothetical protein F4777DRAFT_587648 [Nemania sp. FL0916]|nr:hypothetical protein F4777DRAFT_587648 [Nemania sp. FL0916]
MQANLLADERAAFYRGFFLSTRAGWEPDAFPCIDLIVRERRTDKGFVEERQDWKNILVFGSAVRDIFTTRPPRLFVHAFIMTGISGHTFDAHEQPEKYIRAMCGYLMMSDEEQGLATFIKERDDGLFQTTTFELVSSPIEYQKAIVCQGTSCFLVKEKGMCKYDMVIKFSWTSSLRSPEAELFKKANARGVKGVRNVIGFRDKITSVSELLKDLRFPSPYKLRNTRKHLVSTRKMGTRWHTPYSDRISRALAIYPAGRSIKHFRFMVELLQDFRDAIAAYQSLYFNGKILHRNISVTNIMITDPAKANGFRGMLIDLDLAVEEDQGVGSAQGQVRERTRTLEFIAIGVLNRASHTYRHDLESFFYVLIWLCACRYCERLTRCTFFSRWCDGTYDDIALYKLGLMDITGLKSEYILKEFPQKLESVKPLYREIRDILFSYKNKHGLFTGTPRDSEVLYEPIIRAFDVTSAKMETESELQEDHSVGSLLLIV